MKKFLLLFLLILNNSCVRNQDFPVVLYVDSKFSNNEVQTIKYSLDEWEKATQGIIQYELLPNYEVGCSAKDVKKEIELEHHTIFKCLSSDDFIIEEDSKLNTKYAGLGNLDHIMIISDRLESSKLLFSLLLHEEGHFFGLEHSKNKKSVMYPYVSISCIDQESLNQFCDLYECTGEEIPTCK